jgi:hypothetical protein
MTGECGAEHHRTCECPSTSRGIANGAHFGVNDPAEL